MPDPIPFTAPNWCAHPDKDAKDPRGLSGTNGQVSLCSARVVAELLSCMTDACAPAGLLLVQQRLRHRVRQVRWHERPEHPVLYQEVPLQGLRGAEAPGLRVERLDQREYRGRRGLRGQVQPQCDAAVNTHAIAHHILISGDISERSRAVDRKHVAFPDRKATICDKRLRVSPPQSPQRKNDDSSIESDDSSPTATLFPGMLLRDCLWWQTVNTNAECGAPDDFWCTYTQIPQLSSRGDL